jgi:hypothetical protein
MSASEWKAYLEQMRRYRNKFVAHLDNDRTMHLPHLGCAKLAVQFYHFHIVNNEVSKDTLNGLVDNFVIDTTAYEEEKTRAGRIFGNIQTSRR